METLTDITIIEAPIWVEFTCPECEKRVDMDYNSFCLTVLNLNQETEGKNFKCPYCSKELKVDNIIFD